MPSKNSKNITRDEEEDLTGEDEEICVCECSPPLPVS
jgi:hypothetical protein